MGVKAKRRLKCKICGIMGYQLCDTEATYPKQGVWEYTICKTCVFYYRPEDSYTYVSHVLGPLPRPESQAPVQERSDNDPELDKESS